jgi:general stress protein CsbA
MITRIDAYLFRKPVLGWCVFVFLLVSVLYLAGVWQTLTDPPTGIHFFRQTDSVAFASHYYHFGNGFFEPANFNLSAQDGRAAAEFPLTYYIAGLLYHVVGEKDWVLRSIHLLIFLCGVVVFWRAMTSYTQSYWWAIIVLFSLLSGGIVLQYCNMTLPDAPAMGFALMGWGLFLQGWNTTKTSFLFWAGIAFTLSALLKVVYGIHLLTYGTYLLWLLKERRFSIPSFWNTYKWLLLVFMGGVLLNGWWNYYAITYNELYGQKNFLTSTLPLWNMPKEHIDGVIDITSNYWFPYLVYPSLFHVLGILSLFIIVLHKKVPKPDSWIILINIVGMLAYVVLFFHQFFDHDYYFLVLYIPLTLWLMLGYKTLNSYLYETKVWMQTAFAIFALLLTVLSVNYGVYKSNQRKEVVEFIEETCLPVRQHAKELQQLIPKTGTVVVFGDYTRQGSLYFLKRKGWTYKEEEGLTKYQLDSLTKAGADFLLLLKPMDESMTSGLKEISAPLPLFQLAPITASE